MNTLSNQELLVLKGGAFKWGVAIVVSGIVSFIAGLIDGIINPIKCR